MKMLLETQIYNRKSITDYTLSNFIFDKDYTHLRIINDYSTEFDSEYLKKYTDDVVQYEKKLSINTLMYRSFKTWYNEKWDMVYHFDNDIIHSPEWFKMLNILSTHGLPVTLYRSSFIAKFGQGVSRVIGSVPFGEVKSGLFGGCSILFNKEHIEKIVKNLPPTEEEFDKMTTHTAFDSLFQMWCDSQSRYIVPTYSYCLHYGVGGRGHKTLYDDIALNPEPYLDKIWKKIISNSLL
jgi:hypothetical protein